MIVLTYKGSQSAQQRAVVLWSGRHQSVQQPDHQAALQLQCLMTHHNVQNLLQLLAVRLHSTRQSDWKQVTAVGSCNGS